MIASEAELLKRVRKRVSALKNERSTWETDWKDIQTYIVPRRGRFFVQDVNRAKKRSNNIVNNAGTLAARTLASGMMSGITSPARPWFRLTVPDPGSRVSHGVKTWLSQVERLLYEIFARSNFYNVLPTVYAELGTFGTASMLIYPDYEDVIRCYQPSIGSYWLGNSSRMQVDTFVREYSMTIGQLADEFGLEKLSYNLREAHERGNIDTWIQVTHVIEPNDERRIGNVDVSGMPFRELYFESGVTDDQHLLRVTGHHEFPAMSPRWSTIGSDVYGSNCPGYEALGDVKQLQLMEKEKAKAIQKMVNPPMRAPSSLRNEYSSTLAGDITYVNAIDGRGSFEPAYQVNPRVAELSADIAMTAERVQETYYATLFQMMTLSDRRQITAREIEERHEEKLLALGPVLERLHDELLDPVIDRVFGIALRAGIVPEPPQELQGEDLRIEYISMLSQAQQMIGIGGLERLAGYVGNLAGANPDVLDKMDFDKSVDEYAEMIGVPPEVVRTSEDVMAMRQMRAQQIAQQQAMEQGMQAAQGAKLLSETDAGDESALQMMLRQAGIGP